MIVVFHEVFNKLQEFLKNHRYSKLVRPRWWGTIKYNQVSVAAKISNLLDRMISHTDPDFFLQRLGIQKAEFNFIWCRLMLDVFFILIKFPEPLVCIRLVGLWFAFYLTFLSRVFSLLEIRFPVDTHPGWVSLRGDCPHFLTWHKLFKFALFITATNWSAESCRRCSRINNPARNPRVRNIRLPFR